MVMPVLWQVSEEAAMKEFLGIYQDGTYARYEAWREGEKYFASPYGTPQWGESTGDVFGPYTAEAFQANYQRAEYV
jgi:hypothetical protein